MNAGSLLKEKIKRLGQSNLSEEEKVKLSPVKTRSSPEMVPENSSRVKVSSRVIFICEIICLCLHRCKKFVNC